MLAKTNKSLVYHKHITEFKMDSYLTQVTNTSHRRTLTKLRLSDHKLENRKWKTHQTQDQSRK